MTTNLCTELKPPNLETDINTTATDTAALRQWINDQAKTYQLQYLLAHAEDGVIWGHFKKGSLLTSGEVFDKLPVLRPLTLQQCRIFGKTGEILLWRKDKIWQARLCQDKEFPDIDVIPEDQMLWGTKQVGTEKDDFTLIADGSQGLMHAVPLVSIPFSENQANIQRPIRLKVRHYITYDEDGLAHIFLSRLVDLFIHRSEEKQKYAA